MGKTEPTIAGARLSGELYRLLYIAQQQMALA
jgi:hypothetical protein